MYKHLLALDVDQDLDSSSSEEKKKEPEKKAPQRSNSIIINVIFVVASDSRCDDLPFDLVPC
jgi:hypothetical protein